MNEKIWVALGLLVIGIVLIFVYRKQILMKLQERIERNSVKIPNLPWIKRNGEVITEDVILKRSGIPIIGDWGRIYPAVNEDGEPNKINIIFGGRKNFIKMMLFLILIALFLLGFYEIFQSFEAYKQSCLPVAGFIK